MCAGDQDERKHRRIGGGFKMFFHSLDRKINGGGAILKEEYMNSIVEVNRVSDRIMSLKLGIEGIMLNVVSM